jgi:hypothetical protein
MSGNITGVGFIIPFGILVSERETLLFSGIVTYLALISVGIWVLVIVSSLLRIGTHRVYRWRMQRSLHSK